MKSLDEIVIEKTTSHIERGKDGVSRQVSRTFNHKLNVKNLNTGLRFVHLIVDYIMVSILMYLVGMLPITDTYLTGIIGIASLLLMPIYYTLMEYKFQRTLGKFITKSKVINAYAEKPDLRTCMLRSLIRLVPFEPISYLSSDRGWHDRWSKTYVVHNDEIPKLHGLLLKHNKS